MKHDETLNSLKLAREIADAVDKGNHRALEKIAYLDPLFRDYAKKHVYAGLNWDDIVNDFWKEELIKNNVIKKYRGDNNASLWQFLRTVLHYYILTRNKIHNKSIEFICSPKVIEIKLSPKCPRNYVTNPENPETEGENLSFGEDDKCGKGDDDKEGKTEGGKKKYYTKEQFDFLGFHTTGKSPEEINEEIKAEEDESKFREIYSETFRQFEKLWTDDAELYRKRAEGKLYRDIAAERITQADEERILQEENRIKKQFTRERTGSLARFEILLERNLLIRNVRLIFEGSRTYIVDTIIDENTKKRCKELINKALQRLAEKDSCAANNAESQLKQLSVPQIALLLGVKCGRKLTGKKGKSDAIQKMEVIFDKILSEEKVMLTIDKGLPKIKDIPS